MVKVNEDVQGRPLPCELYFDGYLRKNMEFMGSLPAHDWDNIGLVVGYEGDGKSVFSHQMALGLDAEFCLDHIVFTPEEFEQAVDKAPKGSAIVWDEADDLASAWYDDMLKALKRKMKTIRDKNLHIILVTPTLFDLNKYFAISRTRWVAHIFAEGLTRGFFRFFARDRKKTLYLKGRSDWDMQAAKPNFYGRFTDYPEGFPIDVSAYKEKKHSATEGIIEAGRRLGKNEIEANYRKAAVERFVELREANDWPLRDSDIAEVFGVHRTTISKDLRQIRGSE